MAALAIILSLAAFAGLTGATNYGGVTGGPLNSFVTCNVPFRLSTGDYYPLEREPPLIPLQPGLPGTIWFPVPSGWNAPFGKFSESDALIHLGNDYNSALTSPFLPVGVFSITGIPGYQALPRVVPGDIPDGIDEALLLDYFLNNGYGDFSCILRSEWTDLGTNYYPRYMVSTYCESSNCSFSAGPGCHPDLTPATSSQSPFYVTLLRWDCCQNFVPTVQGSYSWDCGWIKVRVPIIRTCICGCSPRVWTKPPWQLNKNTARWTRSLRSRKPVWQFSLFHLFLISFCLANTK